MSSIGSGYDLLSSQFSPDGRLFQVEYAYKAVENSGTAIGLRGKDGCVFAVEKLVTSKLHEPGTNSRIFTVDRDIGVAVAGFFPDARHLVEYAKAEATHYRSCYRAAIPLHLLREKVSMYMHIYTLFGHLRPFGASLIISAYDDNGPQMCCIEPSGVSLNYFACAIGKAQQAAKTEMEEINCKNKSVVQLIKEAAKIIYLLHDEVKEKHFELELSWVGKCTGGKHELVPQSVYEEAEAYAEDALEDALEDDDEEDP